ncbi:MAG: phospho-N-acetylmuramoyl-pentapeptide-transferase, partial [Muribaculaceae bacterium]|nr:phospho-N-acetylmuramoyl-pentapeptide-transferase [Muribaculaceae bacterium]
MLNYLFEYLREYQLPGWRLMEYITFRSGVAFVLAMLLAIFVGRSIIHRLQRMQIGEIVRNLDLEGQEKKKGTPTMGGIIIILAIMVPCLLVGELDNIYMILMLVSTLWLGAIGFLDDYRKFKYRNKDGLKGKYKIIGQLGIAFIVAGTMYSSPDMTIVENQEIINTSTHRVEDVTYSGHETKEPQTTLPFIKNNNFNYQSLTGWMGDWAAPAAWVVFFVFVMFFVTATSNGANL